MKLRLSFLAYPIAGVLWVSLIAASASNSQVINAELWNRADGSEGITLSADHARPGRLFFKVTNISTDQNHELLLAKADDPEALPMVQSGERIDEDKLKGLTDLGDVHPGATRTTTLTLAAGKYVLFCNEAGHYKAGMYTAFTVAP